MLEATNLFFTRAADHLELDVEHEWVHSTEVDADELMPVLRNYGIRYYSHGSLASGFLTGKYQRGVEPRKGVDRYFDIFSAGAAVTPPPVAVSIQVSPSRSTSAGVNSPDRCT